MDNTMNDKQLPLTALSDEDREKINNYLDEKINSYLYFEDIKKMKLCQRFFSTKSNSSYINSLEILELLISNKLNFQQICEELKYSEATISSINDSLKILKCHNLIDQNQKKSSYYPTNEKWVEDARYKLKNSEILAALAKLLLSFVKANIDNEPSDFFGTIDKLIEFILRRPIFHNVNYELETAIYKAIEKNKTIEIIIKATGKTIKIEPEDIKIVIHEDEAQDDKILIYSPTGTSQNEQISLSEIMLYSSHNVAQTSSTSAHANPNVSNYATFSINQDSIKQKEVKETNAILAVNYLLYEYFVNIDVFEDMEIITDFTYIETLQMEYIKKNHTEFKKLIFSHDSLAPSADFFLLKIKDDYDFIAQEIQKNLEYIKIIYPVSMNDTIKENMIVFLKNEIITQ
jgi:hypothetical protein